MTYTFKLAHRLAVSRAWLLLPAVLYLAPACGTPTMSEALAPPRDIPPGVDEPVYNPSVNTLVFQDGFDSYHLPLDGSGTPNQATFPTTARMQTIGTYSSDPSAYMSASLAVGRTGAAVAAVQ